MEKLLCRQQNKNLMDKTGKTEYKKMEQNIEIPIQTTKEIIKNKCTEMKIKKLEQIIETPTATTENIVQNKNLYNEKTGKTLKRNANEMHEKMVINKKTKLDTKQLEKVSGEKETKENNQNNNLKDNTGNKDNDKMKQNQTDEIMVTQISNILMSKRQRKMQTIRVGNVPVKTTEKHLETFFSFYGHIHNLVFLYSAYSCNDIPSFTRSMQEFPPERKSKFAYITFDVPQSAIRALDANGKKFNNFHLRVEYLHPAISIDKSMLIYFNNVPFDADEEDVRQIFEEFGKVARVLLYRNSRTGVVIGGGFVHFDSQDVAELVLQKGTVEMGQNKLTLKPRLKRKANEMHEKVVINKKNKLDTKQLETDKTENAENKKMKQNIETPIQTINKIKKKKKKKKKPKQNIETSMETTEKKQNKHKEKKKPEQNIETSMETEKKQNKYKEKKKPEQNIETSMETTEKKQNKYKEKKKPEENIETSMETIENIQNKNLERDKLKQKFPKKTKKQLKLEHEKFRRLAVLVGNVPLNTEERHLEIFFSPYGAIERVSFHCVEYESMPPANTALEKDFIFPPGRKSKFAVIRFLSQEGSIRALHADGKKFNNSPLRVAHYHDDLKTSHSKIITIYNVPSDADEEDVRKIFETFGNVTRVILCRNRRTGVVKYMGHVHFETDKSVDLAVESGMVTMGQQQLGILFSEKSRSQVKQEIKNSNMKKNNQDVPVTLKRKMRKLNKLFSKKVNDESPSVSTKDSNISESDVEYFEEDNSEINLDELFGETRIR